jgi:hypothetical protein
MYCASMQEACYYLLRCHFLAHVDHKQLLGILCNKIMLLLEGWYDSLAEFNFTTGYLKGSDNNLADVNIVSIIKEDSHQAMIGNLTNMAFNLWRGGWTSTTIHHINLDTSQPTH